jgi:hypothetical protein
VTLVLSVKDWVGNPAQLAVPTGLVADWAPPALSVACTGPTVISFGDTVEFVITVSEPLATISVTVWSLAGVSDVNVTTTLMLSTTPSVFVASGTGVRLTVPFEIPTT